MTKKRGIEEEGRTNKRILWRKCISIQQLSLGRRLYHIENAIKRTQRDAARHSHTDVETRWRVTNRLRRLPNRRGIDRQTATGRDGGNGTGTTAVSLLSSMFMVIRAIPRWPGSSMHIHQAASLWRRSIQHPRRPPYSQRRSNIARHSVLHPFPLLPLPRFRSFELPARSSRHSRESYAIWSPANVFIGCRNKRSNKETRRR